MSYGVCDCQNPDEPVGTGDEYDGATRSLDATGIGLERVESHAPPFHELAIPDEDRLTRDGRSCAKAAEALERVNR